MRQFFPDYRSGWWNDPQRIVGILDLLSFNRMLTFYVYYRKLLSYSSLLLPSLTSHAYILPRYIVIFVCLSVKFWKPLAIHVSQDDYKLQLWNVSCCSKRQTKGY